MITCLVSQQSDLDLPFPEPVLQDILQKILHHDHFSSLPHPGFVSLSFVDDPEMTNLNDHFRHKNQTTDVLSFSIGEETPSGFLLGEIVISLPKAKLDAEKFNLTFQDEIIRLVVHGLSHLLGYDHQTDEQEKEMMGIEQSFYQLYNPLEGDRLYG